jgi:hypothetical protein
MKGLTNIKGLEIVNSINLIKPINSINPINFYSFLPSYHLIFLSSIFPYQLSATSWRFAPPGLRAFAHFFHQPICKLKILEASRKFPKLEKLGTSLKSVPQFFLSFPLTKHLQLLSLPLSKEFWQPEIERSKHDYKYNIIKGSGDDP